MPSRLPNGHSHDALPTGSSAGIEGSNGDNNAKVTHSTRLSKFRDKFYRQNIDNHRPGDAAPGKEGLLPARRVAESDFRRHETRKGGAPTSRIPALTEFRRTASRHSGTAAHRNRKTQRSRSTGTATEPQDTKVSRLRNREAQGVSEHRGHPEDAPSPHATAVNGPSPRSRRSGTCRRPRGGKAGRHPRSPRCSVGSGTPAR